MNPKEESKKLRAFAEEYETWAKKMSDKYKEIAFSMHAACLETNQSYDDFDYSTRGSKAFALVSIIERLGNPLSGILGVTKK